MFAGEEAWIVGGAVRDEALERPIVDVDVAVAQPERAARRYARASGGAPFPLSERHGAWRVALADGRTVDFTPLTGPIEDDLATRDFSINAIAERAGSGESVDPFGGYDDLAARRLRAVGESVFRDDPLRLLRGPRLEDELPFDFRLVPETEQLIRRDSGLVTKPSKERILAELRRLSVDGFRRLDELGLLEPLGGSLTSIERAGAAGYPDYDLVVVFGENLLKLPISNETRRFARTLPRAEPPADDSPRAIHRFRRRENCRYCRQTRPIMTGIANPAAIQSRLLLGRQPESIPHSLLRAAASLCIHQRQAIVPHQLPPIPCKVPRGAGAPQRAAKFPYRPPE